MAKDRFKAAADQHIESTTHEVPEEHREITGGKVNRSRRIVFRLDPNEYRRLESYCRDKHLAVSSAVRSLVMDAIRRG